jgi:16S rRNA (guanine527-N7)-methyltransferase
MVASVPDAAGVLRAGARELGIELSDAQLESLARFLALIRLWNRRFRLVGTRELRGQINKHILDSLVPARILGGVSTLVDIGTGAGLPGVPLAICCSRLSVTLVDSRRVSANFVREVVREVGLGNATVREERIESLVEKRGRFGPFDATISRAWTSPARFLQVSARLLRPGGMALSMRGGVGLPLGEDAGDLPREFETSGHLEYCLPGGRESRTLVVFTRR